MTHSNTLSGNGVLRRPERFIANVKYVIQTDVNGQASLVKLDRGPLARDGDIVHLTLEDGRVLNCRIMDSSTFCAVVGDGPIVEHRTRVRADD